MEMICCLFRNVNDARVVPDGVGRRSNYGEQGGTHWLDGVVKFDEVLCDV